MYATITTGQKLDTGRTASSVPTLAISAWLTSSSWELRVFAITDLGDVYVGGLATRSNESTELWLPLRAVGVAHWPGARGWRVEGYGTGSLVLQIEPTGSPATIGVTALGDASEVIGDRPSVVSGTGSATITIERGQWLQSVSLVADTGGATVTIAGVAQTVPEGLSVALAPQLWGPTSVVIVGASTYSVGRLM